MHCTIIVISNEKDHVLVTSLSKLFLIGYSTTVIVLFMPEKFLNVDKFSI